MSLAAALLLIGVSPSTALAEQPQLVPQAPGAGELPDDAVIGYAYLDPSSNYPGEYKLTIQAERRDESGSGFIPLGEVKNAFSSPDEIPWRKALYSVGSYHKQVREVSVEGGVCPRSTEWWFARPNGSFSTDPNDYFATNSDYYVASHFTVDLSGLDASNWQSANGMFDNSTATAITFPSAAADTRPALDAGGMFYYCRKLASIDFNGGSFKVQALACAFEACTSLESIDLSGWDTSEAASMSSLFSNCVSLSSIVWGDAFDTSNVTDMSSMFYGCESMTRIDVSEFDTSNVTDMDAMFAGCSLLVSCDLSNFDTRNVQGDACIFGLDINGNVIAPCVSLREIKTGLNVDFGDNKRITMPALADLTSSGTWQKAGSSEQFTDGWIPGGQEATYTRKTYEADAQGGDEDLFAYLTTGSMLVIQKGRPDSSLESDIAYMWSSPMNADTCTWCADWQGDASVYNNAVRKARIDGEGVKPTSTRYWFKSCQNLKEVDLGNLDASVTTNMMGMFSYCKALESIDISMLNTQNVQSMCRMFDNCCSLESVEMSGLDTASLTDMGYMFFACVSLRELNAAGIDTSHVTDMDSMFNMRRVDPAYGKSKLTELDLSEWDASNVRNASEMFAYCYELEDLKLPQQFLSADGSGAHELFYDCRSLKAVDMSQVVGGGYGMFYNCRSLLSLDLRKMDTSVSVARMFQGCSALKELKLPMGFVSKSVTDASGLFSGCSSLESIDTTGFDTSAVKNASAMFYGCSSLEALDVSRFNTSSLADASRMFAGCSALREIDIVRFDTRSLSSIMGMFEGCSSLERMDLSHFDTSGIPEATSASYRNAFDGCTGLVEVVLGENYNAQGTQIGGELPSGMWKAKGGPYDGTVYRPEDIPYGTAATYIRVASATSSYGWLGDDGKFTIVKNQSDVPKSAPKAYFVSEEGYESASAVPWADVRDEIESVDVQSVGGPVSTSNWFSKCSNLANVTIEASSSLAIKSASDMFRDCATLESVDLSHVNLSQAESLSGMFDGCAALADVTWPKGDMAPSGITSFSRMFRNCRAFETLDLQVANMSDATDCSSMFDGCTSLTAVLLPSGNAGIKKPTNLARMFRLCTSLSSIDLSSFDTTKATDFSEMFRGCRSLESLNLAGFSTRSATSMNRMLHGCTSLSTLKVGDGFTFFGATDSRLRGCEFPDGVWQGARQASTEAALADSSEEASEVSGESSSAAYASDSIPSFVADTYTRVEDLTGVSVISLFGSSGDRYAVEQTVNAEGEVELAYDLGKYERDSIEIGDTISAAAAAQLTSSTVKKNTVVREVKQAGSKVTKAVIRPSVNKIEKGAFAKSPSITKLKVVVNAGSKLNKKSSILGSLKGSKIKGAGVQVTTVKIYPDMNENKIVSRAEAVRLCFSKYAWRES